MSNINEKNPENNKKLLSSRRPNLFNNTPAKKQILHVVHHSNTPIFEIMPVKGCALNVSDGSPVILSNGMLNFFPTTKADTNNTKQII